MTKLLRGPRFVFAFFALAITAPLAVGNAAPRAEPIADAALTTSVADASCPLAAPDVEPSSVTSCDAFCKRCEARGGLCHDNSPVSCSCE